MTQHVIQMHLRQAVMGIFAIVAMTGTVQASPPSPVVVVAPMDLPALDLPALARDPVHLDTSGSFDFLSPPGHQSDLVRFRQDNEYAVPDLPRVRDPKLITEPGLTLPGLISDAGRCAAVAGPTMEAPRALYFGPIDTVLLYEISRMFDVKQVRVQMTRTDTGITTRPTESGLKVTRRPGRRVDSAVDGYPELSGGGPGARCQYGLSE